ncbi:glutamyl-tRNA reductase [Alkalibacterium putridalgicola]|uniref:Glutamyl-tRNA reductase n=1 Tax=Alkalibacterium putridalgicola TaxID=426703 RepID=A0A1H7PWH0_9LACT|nr:hypothetical protein [Alkalibacterium putridalgicola]GEK88122.1 hypothetical protein APU01nite_01610 [Alkalibacterium putridalgicola]SEL40190.1 glutamyl-tRNA reductase [Alkalibacterium putridalgicola]
MKLIMYGVNRDTVSSVDIHKYGLDESLRMRHLNDISRFDGVSEIVLVTTDNRNEYYLYIDEQSFRHGDLLRYLSSHTGKCLEEIILETYSKFNHDVVKHLFTLTSAANEQSESVNVLEQALYESSIQGTAGDTLTGLFKKAIEFSLSLFDNETLYPIVSGYETRTIQSLKQYYPIKEDMNFLIIGNNDSINQITKYIIGKTSAYLTFLEKNEKSKAMVANIKKWMSLTSDSRWESEIQSVELSQLVYRLSKADIVIIGPSIQNAWLSEELLDDMFEMRPTAKKQLIIDLCGSQDETLFSDYPALKYTQIGDTPEQDYSLEKIEEARTYYEEYLSSKTNEFMEIFNRKNEDKTRLLPLREPASHNVSFIKRISYKV